jgi:serine/threonine protein kinase
MTLLICSIPKEGSEAYSFKPNKDHLIGMGGFAHVFRAVRKHDQQMFAIKRSMTPVDFLEEKEQQAVYDEIRLMKENPHPFIVKVIDDFLDNTGHLCMVQELYN